RPSHRSKADRSKSSVRAIPWVFGWAQSRTTLPAWYGIGSALEQLIQSDEKQLKLLQAMSKHWPYFRSLLANTRMALYKADMETAKEYSELCEDPATAARIYPMIRDEYKRTVKYILEITGDKNLLDDIPALALSLSRRDPYLDPLSHIQILLLKRFRNTRLSEDEQNIWLSPLLRTINAVATGMRNTG
ncbi:MAG: phosphoenolpyruvate carboxylase, partial [Gammaproteobacteria bacterium]|nr:phosphoenolpyruvate carboxylase [Gammaproteobacteria bacterium]